MSKRHSKKCAVLHAPVHLGVSRPVFPIALALACALFLAACGGSNNAADSTNSGIQTAADSGTNIGSTSSTKRALAAAPAAAGGVMINEVNAGNWKGMRDEDGDAEDWIELYNPANTAVDLSGYGLSNKTTSPFYWAFPAGTQIAARGYLTVWLSKKDRAVAGKPLHTTFNLDNGGQRGTFVVPVV